MARNGAKFEVNPHNQDGFGDLEIWHKLMYSDVWNNLFFHTQRAFFQFAKIWNKFIIRAFTFSVRVYLGYNYSRNSIGVILYAYAIIVLLLYNSSQVWVLFKPLLVPFGPVLAFFLESNSLYEFVFIKIESRNMLYFSMVTTIVGAIQVFMAWFGSIDANQFGKSFLHQLIYSKLSKKIARFQVLFFIEVPVIASLGLYFLFHNDPVFGSYLAISALLIATQELTVKAKSERKKSILNA